MRSDLEAEKRAMQKVLCKRQTQIERVTFSMTTVIGERQGIAHEYYLGAAVKGWTSHAIVDT